VKEEEMECSAVQQGGTAGSKLPSEMLKEMDKIFESIDVNKNGLIEPHEIKRAIEVLSVKDPSLKGVSA
jgi:Ca2+-binding EF-hand superfamily protein